MLRALLAATLGSPILPTLMHSPPSLFLLAHPSFCIHFFMFSFFHKTLTPQWCKMPEVGLPSPDVVLFLDMTIEQAKDRGNFGDERYEVEEFQRTVRQRFQELMETENSKVQWYVIDAARTIEEVEIDVHKHAKETMARVDETSVPVGTLW